MAPISRIVNNIRTYMATIPTNKLIRLKLFIGIFAILIPLLVTGTISTISWFERVYAAEKTISALPAIISTLVRVDSLLRSDFNDHLYAHREYALKDSVITQRKLNKIMRQLGLDPALD